MLDRTQAPPSHPISRFSIPEYRQINTQSGTELFIIEDDKLPVVHLDLIFQSGKSFQRIPGTAYYAVKMLQEGTNSRSASQIAEGFESLGSFVEFSTGLDHCSIKVYAQTKQIRKTLELIDDLLRNANFPNENFEIIKKIRQQQIKQQMAKNSQYATVKFNEMIFGKDHPLGNILHPEEALEVDREEVFSYYQTDLFHRPRVFITGDVSDSLINQLGDIIDSVAGNPAKLADVPLQTSLVRMLEEKENSEQVSLRMGMMSLSKDAPEIHHLTIANTLLGGYFGSRLMKKIREDLGYTYGIYSTIIHTLKHSYWMVSSELVKEHVENGENEIEKQIRFLAENPPSEVELNQLKNYLRGKLLSSLDSIFSKGNLIKGLKLFNLSDDYFDDYLRTIDEITPSEISNITQSQILGKAKAKLLVG